MTVTGPTGPRPAGAAAPAAPTTPKPATTTATPAPAPAAPAGWKPPAAGAGPSTPRSASGFSSGPARSVAAPIAPTASNPVQQAMNSAIDRYTTRVQTQLHHDAMSLARGETPFTAGDNLTAAQQDELKNASIDFMKDIPIGALSPQMAAGIQQKLKDAGVEVRDIASTKLGDLGNIGGDIAKDLVKDLKQDSPGAYYGLAAGAAVAAGYVAWSQGSAGLNKLGIKPEIKQNFFDGNLSVKLGGEWQSHFKNFQATATVAGKVDLGDYGRLTGSVTANSSTGIDRANIGYDITRPNWNLSANAAFNRNGLESLSGRANYQVNDSLRLSAGIDHNFQTNTTSAFGEAAWKVNENTDFALSARRNSDGSSYVGAGVSIRF